MFLLKKFSLLDGILRQNSGIFCLTYVCIVKPIAADAPRNIAESKDSYVPLADTLEDSYKLVICKTLLTRLRGGSMRCRHMRSFVSGFVILHVWLFLKQTDSNSSPLPLFIYRHTVITKLA